MRRPLSLLFACLLAGCATGNTGPRPSVAGAWRYSASNVGGSGLTCEFGGAVLSLTQSGATFTGTYSGLVTQCTDGVTVSTNGPVSGQIVNGTVSGDRITFDFDTPDWHQTGTVSGRSMTGSVTVNAPLGTQTITISGAWAAAE